MAFWLLLATLLLVCHGGFSTASQETSRGPRITSCRSPQLETITCYWTYGDFQNLSTTIKFQYKTSDHQWNDCPDTESAGRNSCYFSKENTSVLWNYHIRLIIENVTVDERSFFMDEIERSTSNSQKQPSSIAEITRGPLQKNIKKTYPPGWPRITECRSSQLETFTCHWTYGEFQNLTGLLKLQYLIPGLNWTDCPDTLSAGENGCYFSKNDTSIWVHYHVRLVSDNDTYYEHTFTIDEIDPPGWPRITECRSSQLETFTCYWTYGEFKNLTGLLKLQYLIPGLNWTDCPDTVSAGENGCYFSENYTSIWVHYHVRLVSDNVTYYEHTFTIDEIEQPTSNPLAVSTKVPLQKIMKRIYPPGWPIITECRSPQQETFTCHWTYGEFHNLTGLIKLQYRKPGLNWTDCPDTVSAGENGCYFNETYTSIWVGYQVRLISDNVTFYEYSFTVDGIVRPDPPRALNWTALNISGTRLHMDIELNWLPPATADVRSGWITLEYEAHVIMANGTKWKTYDSKTTHISIYGLRMGSEYWVKIRCKQKENTVFSEFSEVLIIQLPSKFPDSPWPLFVIVGLFAIVVAMAFFIFCKKDRLKLLILPPVPVPKIKGIDPALLQKGKLDEVGSILASHESYKQQLCIDDPWVEFIELDLDEQDEKNEGADTDRLLGEEYPKTHSCLGVKDDDSGRASCCEPDIPETDFSNSEICDGTSDTGQTPNTKDNQADLLCLSDKPNSGGIPTNSQMPNVEKPSTMPEDGKLTQLLANGTTNVPPSTQLSSLKPSMDFYALVSDITPAGRLLLSPGQRIKMENEECSEPADTQRPTTLNQRPTTLNQRPTTLNQHPTTLNQHPTTLNQHPTTLNMDNAYISESAVTAFHSLNFPTENAPQNPSMDSYFTPESLTAAAMSSRASEKASGYEAPVADYTSVHITNSPQNLVLNTTAPPGKEFTPPCGYMSTDQVNKVMP